MTQSEQFTAQTSSTPQASDSPRRIAPLIVLLVAAAFAANAWFFYHQGQRDAANLGSQTVPAAAPTDEGKASTTVTTSTTDSTATPSDAAQQSASSTPPADENGAAKPAVADVASAEKPASQSAAKTKSANRLVAKANKSAIAMNAKPFDRQATLLVRPKPAYPANALRAHEEGTVVVLAQVDVAGHVSDVSIARHSGSYALDRAAENEVRRWKFEPALRNGRPIMASVEVPVSYRLGE